MRVGIIALLQESNTFVSQQTSISHFEQDLLVTGEAIRDRLATAHHEVGGFFEGLDFAGIEAVPLFAARALPGGVVDAATYGQLLTTMLREVDQVGRLDGYLVAPHGATVAENHPDADGHWLTRLRERVGKEVPIVGTLDPHGNVSTEMVAATDALLAYRTNPHIDQRDRGIEAANLLASTLRGEIRPTQALAMPPIAINIGCQCSSEPPSSGLLRDADLACERPGVLATSVFYGFPYADVAEMGSSILCVTDDNESLAQEIANELATKLWQDRNAFDKHYDSPEAAVELAMQLDGPVCLLDMGDNVGGGSPADGTILAQTIHNSSCDSSFVCIRDIEAVKQAQYVGVGARIRLSIGAKTDTLHGDPLDAEFTVLSIHDGRFEEEQPRHGGVTAFEMGMTAIVRTDTGLTVQLTSRRVAPWSLVQLSSCGLDPRSFKLLVAKGVNAPIAAYREVCEHMIRVDTPGVTAANLRHFNYRQRRRPLFPFEQGAVFETISADSTHP